MIVFLLLRRAVKKDQADERRGEYGRVDGRNRDRRPLQRRKCHREHGQHGFFLLFHRDREGKRIGVIFAARGIIIVAFCQFCLYFF